MRIKHFPLSNQDLQVVISFVFLLATQPALASDGVLEINQACVATGCFTGDNPGFPITITKEGPYVFTSDIDVTGESVPENINAIFINAPGQEGVTINLNGFRIVGPTFCLGTPVTSCTKAGTGIGIDSHDNRVTVRNGSIFGMGDDGIQLSGAAIIENMRISGNAGDGIQVSGYARIVNNHIRRNGGRGLVGSSGIVIGNYINGNLGWGIQASPSMAISQNVITENTGGSADFYTQFGQNICGGSPCP
jgi:hypothetical protein